MKRKSKWVFSVAVSLLLVVALGIPLVTASPTQASYPLPLLDSVNIGNPTSEIGHNLDGWTKIWSGCGWCGPDGNMRLIWGDGGETCDPANNWASVTLDAGSNWATTLKVEHLDGAADDGFNVYVNGDLVGTYVDFYSSNTWTATDFDISSWNFSDLLTIKFEATAPAWGGCGTYGQVAFNVIELWGPYAVTIDIKPGSDPNSINPKSKGVIPVAILGSATFDVTTVDVTTLVFADATPAHDLTDDDTYNDHLQYVNDDEHLDLVSHYRTQDTDIVKGDTDATLTGQTTGGIPITGTDTVRTVGR